MSEVKSTTRVVGAGGGSALAVGAHADWLQIIGIVIAAVSTIWPILEKLLRKKPDVREGQRRWTDTALILFYFLLFAFCFVFTGCVQISGTRAPDGTLTIRTHRLLWASEMINFSVKDKDGFVTTLRVEKSNADAQALGAVAEGVARGMKPGP